MMFPIIVMVLLLWIMSVLLIRGLPAKKPKPKPRPPRDVWKFHNLPAKRYHEKPKTLVPPPKEHRADDFEDLTKEDEWNS